MPWRGSREQNAQECVCSSSGRPNDPKNRSSKRARHRTQTSKVKQVPTILHHFQITTTPIVPIPRARGQGPSGDTSSNLLLKGRLEVRGERERQVGIKRVLDKEVEEYIHTPISKERIIYRT